MAQLQHDLRIEGDRIGQRLLYWCVCGRWRGQTKTSLDQIPVIELFMGHLGDLPRQIPNMFPNEKGEWG